MTESKEIINRTEEWIEKPVTSNIIDSLSISNNLLSELQSEIRKEGVSKKIIGSLIGRVKGIQKSLNSIEMMDWVEIDKGFLSIGHRPSSKLIVDLKFQNTTHVLTLLSENEGGRKIDGMCKKANMDWLWFPMESANPPKEDKFNKIAELFNSMSLILKNNGRIYIHCSAGIHRTGMISYGFLRFLGFDSRAAIDKLEKLRITTREQVGEARLEWGDSISSILKKHEE